MKLDLTRTITPLGARPEPGSALYLACDEALTRPGAVVTLRYRRIRTPEEIADQQGAAFAANVQAAQQAVTNAVKQAIDAMVRIARGVLDMKIVVTGSAHLAFPWKWEPGTIDLHSAQCMLAGVRELLVCLPHGHADHEVVDMIL